MNTYSKADDSPDTQTFSFDGAEYAENLTEESQSILTSLKKDRDHTNLYSQPLFTETENNPVDDAFESHSTRKRIRSEESLTNVSKKCDISSDQDKYCQTDNAVGGETSTDSKNEGSPLDFNCTECIFQKELDKRNYYFGNLLIGELQFLPPCMRSEAYVTILQYVDSLKRKHRHKENND